MSAEQTPNLELPYLMPAQAQKHVTHNEAIRALDALVQISVLDKDLAAPPPAVSDGNRFIVAASPSGVWSGNALKVAAFQDNAWMFHQPREGWVAWIADEDLLYAFDGTSWVVAGGSVNPTLLVGVNATADATNRLSVSAAATLFNHAGAGHQIKLNKATPADTASLLYQTGFSGRAEAGLAGDDDFHFKVSPDGASWKEALTLVGVTGTPRVPAFAEAAPPSPASAGAGSVIFVPDAPAGATLKVSDGATWRIAGLVASTLAGYGISIASQVQAEAGTDNVAAMTALRVAQAIAARTGPKNELAGTRAPAAADDSTQGYGIGSYWFDATTGIGWDCVSAAAGAAAWQPVSNMRPGMRQGLYQTVYEGIHATGNAYPAANTIYAYPWRLQEKVQLTSLAMRCVTGAASSSIKAAVYASSRTKGAPDYGRPAGNPIAVCNTAIPTTATGPVICPVSTVTLWPDVYWFVTKADAATAIFTSISSTDYRIQSMIGRASLNGNTALTAISVASGVLAGAAFAADMPNLTGTAWSEYFANGVPIGSIGI